MENEAKAKSAIAMPDEGKSYVSAFLTMVFLFFIVGFLTTVNTQFQAPLKAAFLGETGRPGRLRIFAGVRYNRHRPLPGRLSAFFGSLP